MAIPATGAINGTPASIKDKVEPQTAACEVEPFEDIVSETTRIAYGKVDTGGITASSALSASAQCPISRLLGDIILPVSPTEYGGKE